MRFKVANYSRLEIRLDTLHIYIGPLVRPGREPKESKKEKKKKKQGKKLTVANWLFAQTTHVYAAICGLACLVVFGR